MSAGPLAFVRGENCFSTELKHDEVEKLRSEIISLLCVTGRKKILSGWFSLIQKKSLLTS